MGIINEMVGDGEPRLKPEPEGRYGEFSDAGVSSGIIRHFAAPGARI